MLTHLHLRDLVLVDQAELELQPGMTALTGETGAGKSIIVDALLLVAGGRASGNVVRQGAERAEVTASFAALPDAAVAWLHSQAIDYEGELVLRRVVSADGRTRAYANGQVIPLQALRELTELLMAVHGQQEFQRLVSRAAQRDLLDEHLADATIKHAVVSLFEQLKGCRREFESLQTTVQNRDVRVDLLRFQVEEIKAEVTTSIAIEELFADQKRIAGKGRLGSAARTALTSAYDADGENAHDLLSRAQNALRGVADSDTALAAAAKLFGEAIILTQEGAQGLRQFLDALDIDPARQDEIERRAAALESLARKHRVPVLELPALSDRLEQELAELEQATSDLAARSTQLQSLTEEYRKAAARLREARRAAAASLSREVTQLMQALGMGGGEFSVAVTHSEVEVSASGSDDIEFLVSANPGQPLKGLAKVASGGELSRISLAIQVAAADTAASLCMVFDEVDAGIGGAVAEIVGRQLRALGEHSQVLCVTHLAQVASQAHAQFRVSKLSDGKITRTALKRLGEPERIDEIARMLGGIDISEQAHAHARDMLARGTPVAQTLKKRRSRAQH